MLSAEMRSVLARRPLGLVFDIDGTLSPIAPTPGAARLYPGVTRLLEQLKDHAHVAIMTGRALLDGAALVNVEGLTYIGTHGLEWSEGLPSTHPVQLVPEALDYVEPGNSLLDLAEKHLAGQPGILVQRKRVGGSLHYRLAPEPEETRKKLLALLEGPAQRMQMRLREGKRVIEILPPLAINKGEALRRYATHLALKSVVFAGDDRTDQDAVVEIVRLRQEGYSALAIVVQHSDTPPALLAQANIIVSGVEGMVAQLQAIAAEIA